MKRDEAEKLAGNLLRYHGLDGWRMVWLNTKTVAGNCNRGEKSIGLSRWWVDGNGFKAVREILLHEIAHALTSGGHTGLWELVATAIGCHPNRRLPGWVKRPAGKWRLTCPLCKKGVWAYRYPGLGKWSVCCTVPMDVEKV